MSTTRVLAIITARGGSKGIPRKNLALVGGKSLLARSVEVALASRYITRTIISTDDPEIAQVGKDLGAEVPALRPSHLAQDDTPTLPVLQHEVTSLERAGFRADLVVLLQPTSPLRTTEQVDGAIKLLLDTGADSVVTVCEVPHHFNPISVMCIEGGRLEPFLGGEGTRVLDRHQKPPVYSRSGPSVVVTRYETLMEHDSLYGTDSRPYVIPWESSIDIDGPTDLIIAEALLEALHEGKITWQSPS